jgi:hypothetical protein
MRAGSRAVGRTVLTGAGVLGLLVGAGGAAGAQASADRLPLAVVAPAVGQSPSANCVGDAQGMMTMPDGMKMPVADMPGCAAMKVSAPATAVSTPKAPAAPAPAKSTSGNSMPGMDMSGPSTGSGHAAPQKVSSGTGGQASAPKHVHAGTGGQAAGDNSPSVPIAPLALVLAGLGMAVVTGRRLSRD